MAGLDIFDVNIFSRQGLVCLMGGPKWGLGYCLNKVSEEFILKIFLRGKVITSIEIGDQKYNKKYILSKFICLELFWGMILQFWTSTYIHAQGSHQSSLLNRS